VRILADTNVFILFTQRLPLPPKVEEALDSTDTVLKGLTGFPHRYFRNRLN